MLESWQSKFRFVFMNKVGHILTLINPKFAYEMRFVSFVALSLKKYV